MSDKSIKKINLNIPKGNEVNLENQINESKTDELAIGSKLANPQDTEKITFGIENVDGKIDLNAQGLKGNCTLLASVNTLIGDDKTLLNDIMTINYKDMGKGIRIVDSVDIKFHNNDGKVIRVKDSELSRGFYKIIALSMGDKDVKALEIAYYKMMEEKGVPITKLWAEPADSILKNLYSPEKYTYGVAHVHRNTKPEFKEIAAKEKNEAWEKYCLGEYTEEQYKNIAREINIKYSSDCKLLKMDLSELNNCRAIACMPKNTEEFRNKELPQRANYLIEECGYDKDEVMAAVNQIKNPSTWSRFKSVLFLGSTRKMFPVPAKNGLLNAISSYHAYTFVEAKDGYVKLRNPWINQEIIEIPEIYFKLICNDITFARPKENTK